MSALTLLATITTSDGFARSFALTGDNGERWIMPAAAIPAASYPRLQRSVEIRAGHRGPVLGRVCYLERSAGGPLRAVGLCDQRAVDDHLDRTRHWYCSPGEKSDWAGLIAEGTVLDHIAIVDSTASLSVPAVTFLDGHLGHWNGVDYRPDYSDHPICLRARTHLAHPIAAGDELIINPDQPLTWDERQDELELRSRPPGPLEIRPCGPILAVGGRPTAAAALEYRHRRNTPARPDPEPLDVDKLNRDAARWRHEQMRKQTQPRGALLEMMIADRERAEAEPAPG
jgi:hypothetical protein